MVAEKGNKVYTIDESMKAQYQNDGFDIKDDNGKIIACGKGKTISYEEYEKLKQENEELKKKLAAKGAPKKAGE